MIRLLAVVMLGLVSILPARAQFAGQMATIAAAGGTANAQTGTLANMAAYADVQNVLLKYTPAAGNTGAATLTLNGLGTSPAFRRVTSSGLQALVGGELVASQPVLIMYDGTYFDILGATNTNISVGAPNLLSSALSFGVPVNLQLNASVSSNQLTISIMGNNGSTPSATNPVPIAFRDATIAAGDPVIVPITSAASFTIGSGNTMGCQNGVMCRLWIVLLNNSGAAQLCAINAVSGTTVGSLDEGVLKTSASGTSGGSSAQTYYCNASAVTNAPMRIAGYVEISETSAGTWATGPTYVQLFGPGIHKPGERFKPAWMSTSGSTSCSSSAQTETAIVGSITPVSAADLISVEADATQLEAAAGLTVAAQLSRGTSPTLIGQPVTVGTGGGTVATSAPGHFTVIDAPNSTSSVTYAVYCKGNSTAGGSIGGTMLIEEIMGALDPANDNAAALAMAG